MCISPRGRKRKSNDSVLQYSCAELTAARAVADRMQIRTKVALERQEWTSSLLDSSETAHWKIGLSNREENKGVKYKKGNTTLL
jgi:hypothetical protein